MRPNDSERRLEANDARVDELRQRLRSLGYLDAGVDRFVLGPARDARRPAAIAALASIRIGVLAAALLGPAAAVGIGSRLPGLVTGPQDAAVVALYLALLFGIAATVVSFAASLLVARMPVAAFARNPRLVSRIAGVVVGAACLAYLTLWWRIASADGGVSAGWTAVVLAVAVAISLLLGHATTITAFAVLVATHGQPAATVAARPPSAWRLTAAAAVLAFSGAAGLLLLAAPGPAPAVPSPTLTVVSPGARMTVVAIDGFDPAVLETLAPSGRVPNMAALFAGATVRLAADAVRDPAREWTTIATGQPPEVHGVHGLETRRVAGLQGTVTSGEQPGLVGALRGATDLLRLTRPSTASGDELRSKTMWEVAADAGLRAGVVNWWATWPATSAGANPPLVVSDRATLRLERGGALDGEIAPDAAYTLLREQWPVIKQEVAASLAGLPASGDAEVTAALRRAAEVDAVQLAIARRLGSPPLDLLAIYLPGLDIAQHALLGSGNALSPSTLTARLEALRGYYVYLDGLLAPLAALRDQQIVTVVAQPGRIATIPYGMMAIVGAAAAAGPVPDARTIDIAPTILHALGVPVSRELAGAPLAALFTAEFTQRFPVRSVDTYGRRAAPSGLREGQPLDREMIERLRSLGYVR